MKVLLLGTRKLGYTGMEAIHASKHKLVGVVTKDYDITEGYDSTRFGTFCYEHKIPCFSGDDQINNRPHILDLARYADIGVSLYWRRLIREPLVSAPKHGFINVHGSDLPKYRGFAAASWAILRGDKEAVVSIHRADDGMADTGDVLWKHRVPITPETTIKTLQDAMWDTVVPGVIQVLDAIEERGYMPTPAETDTPIIDAYPRLPQDGLIDWTQPAVDIDRLVRAVTRPYPGTYTYYRDRTDSPLEKLIIWRAHPVTSYYPPFVGVPGHVVANDYKSGSSIVVTGRGLLALDEVEPIGGRPSDSAPFRPGKVWKSVQIRLGLPTDDEVYRLNQRVTELERRIECLTYQEDK